MLAQLLWIPRFLALAMTVITIVFGFQTGLDWQGWALFLLPCLALLWLFEWMQRRLLERRLPRTKLKAPKRAATPSAPVESPAPLPQTRQERRLATPPLARAVEFAPEPAVASMSAEMRRFVERGDQAINTPARPSTGPGRTSQPAQVPAPFEEAARRSPPPQPAPPPMPGKSELS